MLGDAGSQSAHEADRRLDDAICFWAPTVEVAGTLAD